MNNAVPLESLLSGERKALDHLMYASYAFNRDNAPYIKPESWRKVYINAEAYEKIYEKEKLDQKKLGDSKNVTDHDK